MTQLTGSSFPNPNGCRVCDVDKRQHALRWSVVNGWHSWQEPTDRQRLTRLNELISLRRYHEALTAGLSDFEAREDGWPS